MANGREPLHSRFDLASSPSAVRWGRKHTVAILAQWGVPKAVADDALLIVSELLSNAVQHAAKPFGHADGHRDAVACSLFLWLTDEGLTVSVYDEDRCPPIPRDAPAGAERGRGLRLVAALSEAWGYTHPPAMSGKLVWARLTLPDYAAGDGRRGLAVTIAPIAPIPAGVMSAIVHAGRTTAAAGQEASGPAAAMARVVGQDTVQAAPLRVNAVGEEVPEPVPWNPKSVEPPAGMVPL
jgi:anti-sigma regulatory factor (Ser/Thr protein kinase)